MVALERGIQLAQQLRCALIVRAHDDPVGTGEILDGVALLQELGVRHHAELDRDSAPRELFGDRLAHPIGRAHRHGRFVDDYVIPVHVPRDIGRRSKHVPQVRRAVLVGWRAHGNALQRAMANARGDVGGEHQPSSRFVPAHDGLQPRLEDRDPAFIQHAHLGLVEVEAEHMIAHVR